MAFPAQDPGSIPPAVPCTVCMSTFIGSGVGTGTSRREEWAKSCQPVGLCRFSLTSLTDACGTMVLTCGSRGFSLQSIHHPSDLAEGRPRAFRASSSNPILCPGALASALHSGNPGTAPARSKACLGESGSIHIRTPATRNGVTCLGFCGSSLLPLPLPSHPLLQCTLALAP